MCVATRCHSVLPTVWPMPMASVLTADIWRSASAEWMPRRGLQDWLPRDAGQIEVTGAGTAAVVGSAMELACHAALAARGVEGRGHVAQPPTPEMVAETDLVTMTEERRDTVPAIAA